MRNVTSIQNYSILHENNYEAKPIKYCLNPEPFYNKKINKMMAFGSAVFGPKQWVLPNFKVISKLKLIFFFKNN